MPYPRPQKPYKRWSLGEQITAVLVLILTSKGMALSATVEAIEHGVIPVAAVALLLGADRMRKVLRGEEVDPLDDEAEPRKETALR